MREPKPWLRKSNKVWYIQLDGRQVSLGKDKTQATKKYHALMTGRRTGQTLQRCDAILDAYLDYVQGNRSAGTYGLYKYYIGLFNQTIPNKRADNLVPHDVQRWIDATEWNPTTRKIACRSVTGAFNWAVRQGLLASSPLAGLRAPAGLTRDVLLTDDQWSVIMKKAEPDLHDILAFLYETGCRPGEARAIEADMVRGDHVILPKKDSKGRKVNRVIWMTDAARSVVERLAVCHPTGKLFRTGRGCPWSGNRLARRCEKLDFYCYAIRHSYLTRGLERGVDAISLAILAGHRDTTQIARTYQHLIHVDGHLKDAAKRVRG